MPKHTKLAPCKPEAIHAVVSMERSENLQTWNTEDRRNFYLAMKLEKLGSLNNELFEEKLG